MPETGSYLTDQREPVDAPYVKCALICPYDIMIIIEMDIHKSPLPIWVMANFFTDKTLYGAVGLRQGHEKVIVTFWQWDMVSSITQPNLTVSSPGVVEIG